MPNWAWPGLDTTTADQILQLFRDIREKRGTTLVLVTHEQSLAKRCQRVLTLDAGRLSSDVVGDA